MGWRCGASRQTANPLSSSLPCFGKSHCKNASREVAWFAQIQPHTIHIVRPHGPLAMTGQGLVALAHAASPSMPASLRHGRRGIQTSPASCTSIYLARRSLLRPWYSASCIRLLSRPGILSASGCREQEKASIAFWCSILKSICALLKFVMENPFIKGLRPRPNNPLPRPRQRRAVKMVG